MEYTSCPHCSAQLGINPISEGKVLSKCPNCGKLILIVNEAGIYSMKKPQEYKCKKCGSSFIYDERPPIIHCEKCNELLVTSDFGNHLLEASIFAKGEKEGFVYQKKEDKLVKAINAWKAKSFKFKAGVIASVVALLGLLIGGYIWSLPQDILTTSAYADNARIWSEFREKNPYNIQIVGIRKYDDGSYNLIMSEPSEDVAEKDLSNFFKKYNGKLETYQKPIGFDGWLKDAVVSFNDLEESDIPKLTDKLFNLLYGTDYKSFLYDFDAVHEFTDYSMSDLNMQVSEEELRDWLLSGKEKFHKGNDSESSTLKDLLSGPSSDVFYSDNPGFVVWMLDEGVNDETLFRINSRIFALDSDIILGAIKKNQKIAIIGREREVSLWDLPPLRSETLRILAATKKDELAQSYERTRLLAGKLSGTDGGKDWAPILLSDALWHTEYGNILNVTDQMLKSWSQNGDIEYEEFDYQKPSYWAFKEGAREDLKVNTLTYNWNTEGVGYVVDDGDYEIYALNRTGSLPVSYIPGESEGISSADPVYQAEELAYDFFSSLSNTSLVRVVQYASMYQIFKNFGVSLSFDADDDSSTPLPTDEMYKASKDLLREIRLFSKEETVEPLLEYYNKKYKVDLSRNGYDKYADIHQKGENLDNLSDFKEIYRYFHDTPDSIVQGYDYVYGVLARVDSLRMAIWDIRDDRTFMSSFSRFLIDAKWEGIEYESEPTPITIDKPIYMPGSDTPIYLNPKSKDEKVELAVGEFLKCGMDPYLRGFLNYSIPEAGTSYYRDNYCNANKEKARQWMKCPTVVQSWQRKDSIYAQGGHNLNSKVTSFKVNKNLKPGQIKEVTVDGRKVYEVSPSDLRNGVTSQSYLRRVGRLGDASLKCENTSVRPRGDVISTAARSERGCAKSHVRINATDKGFEMNGRPMSWGDLLEEVASRISKGDENLPFREIEITNFDRAGVEIQALIDGVSYRLPRGKDFDIPLSKFDMSNYSTEVVGDKAVVRIPIKAGKLEMSPSSSSFASMNLDSNLHSEIPIKEGYISFKVPKSRLQEFIALLMEYFNQTKERWNQFHLQRKMRQRGIDPSDIQESNYFRVAKNNIFLIRKDHVRIVS